MRALHARQVRDATPVPGSSPYFPPLAPVGAPTGSAPGVSQKGSSGSGSGGSGGSSKNTSSGGSSSSSTTSSSSRSDQGEGQEYGQGGYTMDAGAMRPLNPAEVQAASSLSSAQGSPAAGSSPGVDLRKILLSTCATMVAEAFPPVAKLHSRCVPPYRAHSVKSCMPQDPWPASARIRRTCAGTSVELLGDQYITF